MICAGKDVLDLVSGDWFKGYPEKKELVRFASLFSHSPKRGASLPISLPETGDWDVKLLAVHERFVVGVYRRHMKAISRLGALDRLFGAPATTRSWNTLEKVAGVLRGRP